MLLKLNFKLIITILLLIFLSSITQVYASTYNPVLFWGVGCPHCEEVKNEIINNQTYHTIEVEQKEIYYDKNSLDIFHKLIKQCGINPNQSGVPMVYFNGQCYMGRDESLFGIQKAVEVNQSGEELVAFEYEEKNTIQNPISDTQDDNYKGKRNTELMLIIIFVSLVCLLIVGYILQDDKKNSKKRLRKHVILLFGLIILLFFSSYSKSYAICPVCTVAVGAGLGVSRYLGIDDLITSIWIGGLIVSLILSIKDFLEKKKLKGPIVDILNTLLMYGSFLIFLYFTNSIGLPLNMLWGIDKVLLGLIIGSISFFTGAKIHFALKNKNGKVLIPFQKVIIPVTSMWIMNLIFYFIVY